MGVKADKIDDTPSIIRVHEDWKKGRLTVCFCCPPDPFGQRPTVRPSSTTLQLLHEQTLSLQEQERLLHRRLAEERRDGLADAADMKRRNREACCRERAEKEKQRAEALRIQRRVTESARRHIKMSSSRLIHETCCIFTSYWLAVRCRFSFKPTGNMKIYRMMNEAFGLRSGRLSTRTHVRAECPSFPSLVVEANNKWWPQPDRRTD